MSASAMSEYDPYQWKAINVLKNRLNIREAARLREAETEFTALRAATIALGPPEPGLPHLQAIHRTLFQDLFTWAGELREVDIYREDTPFCHFEYLEKNGNKLMAELAEEHFLTGLDHEKFAARLAYFYCELNVLHPFREGNGRALRIFFEHLIIHCSYEVDWSLVERESWIAANKAGVNGGLQGLTAIFSKVVKAVGEKA
ncbi:cell filamentation protein Fic [Enterobacterales bacterium CwR94]|nr:cell filamentation protein Fic [Enterobacterales bacterium CwR94]